MLTPETLDHPATTADQPRLRLAGDLDRSTLDGGWWPRSRHLADELPQLLDHLPARVGRVVHVVVSPPDWDEVPRRVLRHGGQTKVGSFPRDDSHAVLLMTSTRVLRLLVVPASTEELHAHTLLAVASHPGNHQTAAELLGHDAEDLASETLWEDEGGHYWGVGGHPSERTLAV